MDKKLLGYFVNKINHTLKSYQKVYYNKLIMNLNRV